MMKAIKRRCVVFRMYNLMIKLDLVVVHKNSVSGLIRVKDNRELYRRR